MVDKNLEKWKIERIVGWLDVLFDTCFLAFIWIMKWKVFFWFYVGIFILSSIGNSMILSKLDKNL